MVRIGSRMPAASTERDKSACCTRDAPMPIISTSSTSMPRDLISQCRVTVSGTEPLGKLASLTLRPSSWANFRRASLGGYLSKYSTSLPWAMTAICSTMPGATTLMSMPLARETMAGPMPKHMTSMAPDAIAWTMAGPLGKRVSSRLIPASLVQPMPSMTKSWLQGTMGI
jgi:hypothetical protein